jgi:hypothetical protein
MDHYKIKMGHLRQRKKAEPDEGTTRTDKAERAFCWCMTSDWCNGKSGKLKEKWGLFSELFFKGLQPNVQIYSTIRLLDEA